MAKVVWIPQQALEKQYVIQTGTWSVEEPTITNVCVCQDMFKMVKLELAAEEVNNHIPYNSNQIYQTTFLHYFKAYTFLPDVISR